MAVDVVTVTEVTVTVVLPVFPPPVAEMVAVPAVTPVTTPVVWLTLATPDAVDDQLNVVPSKGWPLASLATALSVIVPPTGTLGLAGVTSTVTTPPSPPPPGSVGSSVSLLQAARPSTAPTRSLKYRIDNLTRRRVPLCPVDPVPAIQ